MSIARIQQDSDLSLKTLRRLSVIFNNCCTFFDGDGLEASPAHLHNGTNFSECKSSLIRHMLYENDLPTQWREGSLMGIIIEI